MSQMVVTFSLIWRCRSVDFGLRAAHVQRRNWEARRARFESILDAKIEALAEELLRRALDPDAPDTALREAIHQVIGRPAQTVEHQAGDKLIEIVVRSAFPRDLAT